MVGTWAATGNEMAVLTTYAAGLADLDKDVNGRFEVPLLCALTFDREHGLPRNSPATAAIRLTRPKLSTLWAAGFSFSKCHADAIAPYDPNLPQIFDGEDALQLGASATARVVCAAWRCSVLGSGELMV